SPLSESVREARALRKQAAELHWRNQELAREFERLWHSYPRRVGKRAAFKAFTAAVKRHPKLELVDFSNAVAWYAESVQGKDPQYVPHAATWFNGDRFLEEFDEAEEGHSRERQNGQSAEPGIRGVPEAAGQR